LGKFSSKNKIPMQKAVTFLGVFMIPVVFIFLIYIQIENIYKPVDEYTQTTGTVETVGVTIRISWGYRAKYYTQVFFVRLVDNDTLYYFYRRDKKYETLIDRLDKGDKVIIYNYGYDKQQNMAEIIQLEKQNNVIISKREYDSKARILNLFFTISLIAYFYLLYRFSFRKKKRRHKNKKKPTTTISNTSTTI
jgi:preprotein translocase subunit YajC